MHAWNLQETKQIGKNSTGIKELTGPTACTISDGGLRHQGKESY